MLFIHNKNLCIFLWLQWRQYCINIVHNIRGKNCNKLKCVYNKCFFNTTCQNIIILCSKKQLPTEKFMLQDKSLHTSLPSIDLLFQAYLSCIGAANCISSASILNHSKACIVGLRNSSLKFMCSSFKFLELPLMQSLLGSSPRFQILSHVV